MDFYQDRYVGKPKILFIGLAHSSHTHEWINLLHDAELNIRFFGASQDHFPPADWPVWSYIPTLKTPPTLDRTRRNVPSRVERWQEKIRWRFGRDYQPYHWHSLAKLIREWQPDIVHTLGLEPASYLYAEVRQHFALDKSIKWVVQARGGPDLALNRLLPEYAGRIRAVLADCDQFIADNQQNYRLAVEEMGLAAEKCAALGVVPGAGGVDVEALAARWQDKAPSQRERVVVWPKAYEWLQSKALPVLEALQLAWEQIQPCKIYMLAAIQTELKIQYQLLPPAIREASEMLERVPHAETLTLLTQARVMLAPSLFDGVPNTLYESMAAGAVPIVSPLETILPVVNAEENVFFARNMYPHEIAEALIRAMNEDAQVDRMARDNLALVRRIANRTTIAPRVVAYYESLLG